MQMGKVRFGWRGADCCNVFWILVFTELAVHAWVWFLVCLLLIILLVMQMGKVQLGRRGDAVMCFELLNSLITGPCIGVVLVCLLL